MQCYTGEELRDNCLDYVGTFGKRDCLAELDCHVRNMKIEV